MKKFFLPLFLLFILNSFTGNLFGNTAPVVPVLNYPNDTNFVQEAHYFFWYTSTDPDGDTVFYDFYLGTDSTSLQVYLPDLCIEDNEDILNDSLSIFKSTPGFIAILFNNYLPGNKTYYWKVVAKDKYGASSETDTWHFWVDLMNTSAPEKPGNPIPQDGLTRVSTLPDISWDTCNDRDNDTVTYDLYLGTTSANTKLIAGSLAVPRYSFGKSLHGNTTYYWKVVANDNRGKETAGETWAFTTRNTPPEKAELTWPQNDATNMGYNVKFQWGEVVDMDGDDIHYEFWYGNSIVPDKMIRTPQPFIDLNLKADTTYYWRVVTVDTYNGSSSSELWHFATARESSNVSPHIAQILNPADNSSEVPLEVTLTWASSFDVDNDTISYDLFFGHNPDSLFLYADNLADTLYEIRLNPGENYYWQVQVNDGNGGLSETPVHSFTTTNSDVLLNNLTVYYRYSGTLVYEYKKVSLTPGFDNAVKSYSTIGKSTTRDAVTLVLDYDTAQTSLEVEVPPGFTYTENIHYNIGLPSGATRMIMVEGNFSQNPLVELRLIKGNAIRTFEVQLNINKLPTEPMLLSPAEGEKDVAISPYFSWSAGDDAEGGSVMYSIYRGTAPDNLSSYAYAFNSKEYHNELFKLREGLKYYWKVIATDMNGESSESDVHWFITGEGEADTSLVYLYPREISTYVGYETELAWKMNADIPVIYDLYFGTTSNPDLIESNLTEPRFMLEDLSPNTAYYWKVMARDNQGRTWMGEVREFRTKPLLANETGTFTDTRDGQVYQWVDVNGRKWMVHNLSYKPSEEDGYYNYQYWYDVRDEDKKNYSMYLHSEDYLSKYGYLYDWKAALDYDKVIDSSEYIQGLCPCGWRVATHDDWTASFYPLDETTTIHYSSWSESSKSNEWLNQSGLSILPSSYRNSYEGGKFYSFKGMQFWLARRDPTNVYGVGYSYYNDNLRVSSAANTSTGGAAIRCVKVDADNTAPEPPVLISPQQNQTGAGFPVSFQWNKAFDKEGGELTYSVYIDTLTKPHECRVKGLADTVFVTDGLKDGTTYYWKVRVTDAGDDIAESAIYSFTTADAPGNHAPGVPVLTSPVDAGEVLGGAVTFSWDAPADADGDVLKYAFFFGLYEGHQELLAENIINTTYEINNLEVGKTYYWKVRATDAKGGVSESGVWHFTIQYPTANHPPSAPVLLTPPDGNVGTLIYHDFSWEKAVDSDGDKVTYTLYRGKTESTMLAIPVGTSTVSDFGGNAIPNNQVYYWKVVASDGRGGETSSELRTFTTYDYISTNVCSLNSPAHNSKEIGLNPTLKWTKYPATNRSYDVYLNDMLIAANLTTDSLVVEGLLGEKHLKPHTIYDWKVITKNVWGAVGISEEWRFTTLNADPSIPVLYAPTNGTAGVGYNPQLIWGTSHDDDDNLLTYKLYLDTKPDPQALMVEGQDTVFQAVNLLPNTTYYWKVEVLDPYGGKTESEIRSFIIQNNSINTAPTAPQLIGPKNYDIQTTAPVTLKWYSSWDIDGDAVQYNVYMDDVAAPAHLIAKAITDTTFVVNSIDNSKYYYWKVVAVDAQNDSTSSKIWRFKGKNQVPAAPQIVYPEDGVITYKSIETLAWTASTDPDGDVVSYDVYLGTSKTQQILLASGITDLSCSTGLIANNTTYYWKVVANDSNGGQASSGIFSITGKNDAPASPGLIYPIAGTTVNDSVIDLTWHSTTDVDDTDLIYTLYLGESAGAMQKQATLYGDTTFRVKAKQQDKPYYWKVVVADKHGAEAESGVETFTYNSTGENMPPAVPRLIYPVDMATEIGYNITLVWGQSIDPEGGSVLYSVYLNNSLVLSGIHDTVCELSHLDAAKTYTWKIVAYDVQGNQSESPAWKFTTSPLTNVSFAVSGTVKNAAGDVMSGVELAGFPQQIATDENGNYLVDVPAGWSGSFYPVLADYSFLPQHIVLNNLQSDAPHNDFVGQYEGEVTLSGKIIDGNGNVLAGVSVSVAGGVATTDLNGEFSVVVSGGWSGTITAEQKDYSFTPVNYVINQIREDRSDLNFTAAFTGDYMISGTIKDASSLPLGNVKVTANGDVAYTDNMGYYALQVPSGWSGTIVPELENYQFVPQSIMVSNIESDKSSQDFEALYVGNYTLSGIVTDGESNPLYGVELTGFPQEVTTNVFGVYKGEVPAGWSGTIIPVKDGYRFAPEEIVYSNINEDKASQHFQALILNSVPGYSLHSLEIYPNPASGSVLIRLGSIDGNSALKVEIVTLQNLLVNEFEIPNGVAEVCWKGDDSAGNQVPPGIYICRIMIGNKLYAAAKIVVVK